MPGLLIKPGIIINCCLSKLASVGLEQSFKSKLLIDFFLCVIIFRFAIIDLDSQVGPINVYLDLFGSDPTYY